ncbi:MAG: minor capsid protein, partial [Thermoguttaceae bacterium]|nr:minor capsid protein [Thermoguttaceae bacterium]
MAENRNIPKSKFQGDLKLGGIYWKDAVRVRQNEGLNQWQKNHFRLMKMVEYQESVVQGALERLLTRIGIEYSRKEYVPTNDEILDKLMSIDPEVQKLVLLNGKAAAMEMFVKQNYDLKGRYRNIFQGGRVPRNMTLKVINDYLDEVDAPSMEPSALEAYTSQMRSGLAEVTQRHIAKSVAQMTAWNWSRGRGIEDLTRRFQEEQEKEDIDMSKVLPNVETVIRTESMKIMNAEAWRSATEVGSYADGLLWGFSYHAVGDSRTRETHLAQHGVCAPVDDPFWNEWTPPNGYNCRCWLISEWEEPSSYKQPRRDLHPDPGFAFNPANNVSGRVPQQKKQEPPKLEVNTQSESVVKPDELGKDDAASEKNFEKKGKNIQKPVTSSKKKRYN